VIFCDILAFRGEESLASPPPRPTSDLDRYPFSAVRHCVFNVFAASLRILLRCHMLVAVVTRDSATKLNSCSLNLYENLREILSFFV
jgi:hypothetical protein